MLVQYMCLLALQGGDFGGYATDVTFTFPSTGVFTEPQRAIYKAVLDAQRAVLESMRPGVEWTKLHRLAERTILKHLKVRSDFSASALLGLPPMSRHRVAAATARAR